MINISLLYIYLIVFHGIQSYNCQRKSMSLTIGERTILGGSMVWEARHLCEACRAVFLYWLFPSPSGPGESRRAYAYLWCRGVLWWRGRAVRGGRGGLGRVLAGRAARRHDTLAARHPHDPRRARRITQVSFLALFSPTLSPLPGAVLAWLV